MGAIAVIAIIILLWRMMRFYSLFNDNQEALATINDVSFFRDRGRITYIHKYNGGNYVSSHYVMKNSRTKSLAVGDQVTVLVDRNNPKKAFIKDLFI
jgi:hypothetical protein